MWSLKLLMIAEHFLWILWVNSRNHTVITIDIVIFCDGFNIKIIPTYFSILSNYILVTILLYILRESKHSLVFIKHCIQQKLLIIFKRCIQLFSKGFELRLTLKIKPKFLRIFFTIIWNQKVKNQNIISTRKGVFRHKKLHFIKIEKF